MKKILKTLMVATAIALVTVPAFGDSLCFDRHYDAAHLGNHPDQLVTSMTLALDLTMYESRIYDFKIAMTKRGDNNLYVQAGFVINADGKYHGVVVCDGGGFILQKAPSGVLLSIDSIRMAVVPEPCDGGDFNNSNRN